MQVGETVKNKSCGVRNKNISIYGRFGIFRSDSKTELITKINVCGDCRHYTFVMSRDGKRGIVGSLGAVARYFTINDKNQVNASVISQSIISSTSSQLFVLAEKSPTLIVGNSGTIFNQSFSVQKNLINEVPLFLQSIFDQEENYIYAIGGYGNGQLVTKTCERYKDGQWEFISNLNIGCANMSCCTFGKYNIY